MTAARPGAHHSRAAGFALIVVLWFLVLIAAIGTYLLANSRTETAIARNIRGAASAEALADAGVAQAAFNLTNPILSDRWPLDGAPHMLLLSGGEVTIRVSDENAKVNPNHASDALLAALLEGVGVERNRARRLGAAVADWVGAEAAPRPLGAKLQQYQEAGLSYGPPNAPIESLDELQLVLGMTPEIFAAIRPYLTIYTETEAPDPKNATLIVRRALAVAAQAEEAVENEVPEEDAEADDEDQTPETPQPAAPQAAAATMPMADIVHVEVTARSNLGGIFVRNSVIKIEAGNPKGYFVLDWRRGDLVE